MRTFFLIVWVWKYAEHFCFVDSHWIFFSVVFNCFYFVRGRVDHQCVYVCFPLRRCQCENVNAFVFYLFFMRPVLVMLMYLCLFHASVRVMLMYLFFIHSYGSCWCIYLHLLVVYTIRWFNNYFSTGSPRAWIRKTLSLTLCRKRCLLLSIRYAIENSLCTRKDTCTYMHT